MGRVAKFTDKKKWCPKCEKWLLLGLFGNKSSEISGKYAYCKSCTRKTNYKYKRKYEYRKSYGITPERADEIWEGQHHQCAICKKPITSPITAIARGSKIERACLDHDHATGEVRGLLCNGCNLGLGYLCDNIQSLRNALEYLAHPPAVIF